MLTNVAMRSSSILCSKFLNFSEIALVCFHVNQSPAILNMPLWHALLLLVSMQVAKGFETIATVSALYSFYVDPVPILTEVTDRFAVALNRSSNSTFNSMNFKVVQLEGLAGVPCDELLSLPVSATSGLAAGCHRLHFNVTSFSNLSAYEVNYYTEFWPMTFASLASDTLARFTVHVRPDSPEDPRQTWLGANELTNTSFATWLHRKFPQDVWTKQSPDCVSGAACSYINIAPSTRYQHSAIVYKSWNFQRDVLGHPYLCNLGQGNTGCTETCLTDPSCFGASNWSYYFLNNAGAYLWGNTKEFAFDDGLEHPFTDAHSSTCPPACCGERRICMRTRDDMGRQVPFDRSYMLVYGGRTRQKKSVNGLDVYLKCPEVLKSGAVGDQTYASCLEYQSEELWRYDISGNVWELLKPRAADGSSFPSGRFGHAAALVVIDAANDLQQTRRQYMFVLGGFSTDCAGGLCNDLWRYEIPWAAQAFWPANSQTLGNWNRGNVWTRMKDCPIGGLYRHTMVSTNAGTQLLVYGGQQAGQYSNQLLIYTLSSNSWEIKQAQGYPYFTRSVVDYFGVTKTKTVSDLSQLDDTQSSMDSLGPLMVGTAGGQVPLDRADQCSLMLTGADAGEAMLLMNGFRTYASPYPKSNAPYPNYPYYLEKDMWKYNVSANYWEQVFVNKQSDYPSDRKGAAAVLIPRQTGGDDTLLLFGGNKADTLMGDFWTMDVQRAPREERMWRRIDKKWNGTMPNQVTYHSMVYDSTTEQVVIFGGLRWNQADLTETDALVDDDRRCQMAAVNVGVTSCSDEEVTLGGYSSATACALAKAQDGISTRCNEALDNSTGVYCCNVNLAQVATLADLSNACLAECVAESFTPEFSAYFGEGLWVMSPKSCANDCSGDHGVCELSVCKCRPGWTGTDCSLRQCPGTFCYFDSVSWDQHCVECSSNGLCEGDGSCTCNDGWTGTDCSMTQCPGNGCSDKGTCLSENQFPINQCVCEDGRGGYDCSKQLCLNSCSNQGNCTVNGTCACQDGFYGDDCSVYVFTASAGTPQTSIWLMAALLGIFW